VSTGESGAGLGLMSSGAWFSYVLTSSRLAAAGKLPLRLMDFLDDAYRLGLLRMTGLARRGRWRRWSVGAADEPVDRFDRLGGGIPVTGGAGRSTEHWGRCAGFG
jgi:hypothetical protein